MAVDIPTVDRFLKRYPEFTSVNNDLIQEVINEASLFVDETWNDIDQAPAIMALTAHWLTLEGYPQDSIGTTPGGGGGSSETVVDGSIEAIKVGDVSVSFGGNKKSTWWNSGSAKGSASEGDYLSTPYGAKFLRYRKRNFPAVAVV